MARADLPIPFLGRAAPATEASWTRLRQRIVSWFAVGVLIHSTAAFFPVYAAGPDGATHPAVYALWGAAYATGAAIWLQEAVRTRGGVYLPGAVALFVVLALLSGQWSVSPPDTTRSSIALAGTIVIGLLFAHVLRPVEFLDAVRRAMSIVAIASLLVYLAGDALALDPVYGTLRGVLAQKNVLGRAMALGLLATILAVYLNPSLWRRRLVSALPMVTALVLSASGGGVLLAVLGAVSLTAIRLWRSDIGRALVALAGWWGALGMYWFLLIDRVGTADALGVVGKSTDLTGRTDIWAGAFSSFQERPVAGYGFGAFWETDAADAMSEQLEFEVVNAHNGLLEVGLGLGVVGVLAVVAILFTLLHTAASDYRARQTEHAAFRAFVLVLAVASTLVESGLMAPNEPLTLLVVVACATRAPRQTSSWTTTHHVVRTAPVPATDSALRRRE